MGLFSSSKKTYVSSTTINVIGTTGNIGKTATIDSIFKHTNLTDSLLTAYGNSLQLKFQQAYNYAKTSYTLGLPQGSMDYGLGDPAAVKTVLETLTGTKVVLAYCFVSTESEDEFALQYLASSRGWAPDSGEITIHPFYTGPHKVYFSDAKVVAAGQLQINYSYTDNSGATFILSETISYPGLRMNAPYYHVCYYKLNSNGTVQPTAYYWNYCPWDGTHPSLNLTSALSLTSPFYPIVPIRKDNVDLTHSSKAGTELYQTSKKLVQKLGLDFLKLGEGVNANPDVGEIDHAYLYLGVDLQSDVAATQKYLTQFFAYLAGISNHTYQDYVRWERNKLNQLPPGNTLTIEDAGYKAEVTYNYIRVRALAGSIGKIGTVTRTNTIRDPGRLQSDYAYIAYASKYERSSITFRQQIATNSYLEVEIRGLKHSNYVYKRHTVRTTLEDSIQDDCSFILPLHRAVFSNLSVRDRTAVAHDGVKMVFNSYKTVKSKWYESGFFQFITIVVAVAAVMIGAWQAALAVSAAATATEVLVILLTSILELVAWTVAFKMVSKVLGAELTLILAAMFAMYAIGSGIKAGSIKGAPFASELLQASSGLTKAATENIAADLADLTRQSSRLQDEQEAQWEKLEAAQALLAHDNLLDPMNFTNTIPAIFSYESPEEYYYRTVHSGNIGVLSLDAPTNYVEYMLTLPQASGYTAN